MANSNVSILTTSNTFQNWLTNTNLLANLVNALLNGSFYADNGSLTLANGSIVLSGGSGTLLTVSGNATVSQQITVGSIQDLGDATVQGNNLILTSNTSLLQAANAIRAKVLISNNNLQAINATFTGQVTQTGAVTLTLNSSFGGLIQQGALANVNTGLWTTSIGADGGYNIQARNDSQSNTNQMLVATRSNGTSNITSIIIGNVQDNPAIILNGSATANGLTNKAGRTYLGKDTANTHWLATTDPIGEPAALGYGFSSNGNSVILHQWTINGNTSQQMSYTGNPPVFAVPGTVNAISFFTKAGLDVTGQANAAYAKANAALPLSGGTITGALSQTGNGPFTLNTTVAQQIWLSTSANVNTGLWTAYVDSSGTFNLQARNDNQTFPGNVNQLLSATRANGTSNIVSIQIGDTRDNAPVTIVGSLTLSNNNLKAYNQTIDPTSAYSILNGNAVFNNMTVKGNQTIVGSVINSSDTLVLRVNIATDGDGHLTMARGNTGIGNADLKFFAVGNVWQVTANSNASYSTLISMANVVDNFFSTSNINVATANAVNAAYSSAIVNAKAIFANNGAFVAQRQGLNLIANTFLQLNVAANGANVSLVDVTFGVPVLDVYTSNSNTSLATANSVNAAYTAAVGNAKAIFANNGAFVAQRQGLDIIPGNNITINVSSNTANASLVDVKIDLSNTVGIGTPATTNPLSVQGASGANTIAEITLGDGTHSLRLHSNLSPGAWNPGVKANDHGIIYTDTGANTGNLFIGPWSALQTGMRLDNNGNVTVNVFTATTITTSAGLDVVGQANAAYAKANAAMPLAGGTFTGPVNQTGPGAFTINTTSAQIILQSASANVNTGLWTAYVDSAGTFNLQARNDNQTFPGNVNQLLSATRSNGTSNITAIYLGNNRDYPQVLSYGSLSANGLTSTGTRTYLGKDTSNTHWLATTDALAEPNNLGYGFISNGSSIITHLWTVGGNTSQQMKYTTGVTPMLTVPGTVNTNAIILNGQMTAANNVISQPTLKAQRETYVNVGTVVANTTIDLSLGTYFDITLANNVNLFFQNAASQGSTTTFSVMIRQTANGSNTITFPNTIYWSDNRQPVLTTTANSADVLQFFTYNNGSIYWGAQVFANIASANRY